MSTLLIFLIIAVFGGGIYLLISLSNKKENKFYGMLKEYGFTLTEMASFTCTYVGGHPAKDKESLFRIIFGVKEKKLIFFETSVVIANGLSFLEGEIQPKTKVRVTYQSASNHLFDINIENIQDIRYFDATTTRPVGLVGGSFWAIPINMKRGDASVLIDWAEGKYSHSTEFRVTGPKANERANTLRNALIRMTQSR
ncbi:MAG: hypothetical protein LBC84_07430 [Prevotellaceae bacterium]|jgi:hypothetical protein|nr:hypothetical protein [Prevotellaceae bacterium]